MTKETEFTNADFAVLQVIKMTSFFLIKEKKFFVLAKFCRRKLAI